MTPLELEVQNLNHQNKALHHELETLKSRLDQAELALDHIKASVDESICLLRTFWPGLTQAQARVLSRLIQSSGRPVSRLDLIAAASESDETSTKTIDVHITRIRRMHGFKMGWISTVWGLGYAVSANFLAEYRRLKDLHAFEARTA